MRVLQVVAGINPASGGPTRSVKGLCRALSKAGLDVDLLVLSGHHPFDDAGQVNVIYRQMVDVRCYDLVHLHGLWNPVLHRVVIMCRKDGVPYVISPRGMLDPWALSVKKWKKKLAMLLYQSRDLKYASAIHATAKDESDHICELGFRNHIIIAPNGVTLPPVMPEKRSGGSTFMHTAIFLSRLHPGKGLLTLAEAWARVRPSGWRMRVIGPDSYGHKKEVLARVSELGILRDWQFEEAMDDERKWSAYRSADLLIHPSVSENFGITIAEGLAAGLPVIATKGTPWAELEERRCGWWIDMGVTSLEVALREAMGVSDGTRRDMGDRGRLLVAEKYSWKAVARKMISEYMEIVNAKA